MTAFPVEIPDDTEVIETLRYDPDKGCIRRAEHLARLSATCAKLGFSCDIGDVEAQLDALDGNQFKRIRISVTRDGEVTVLSPPLTQTPVDWRVRIHPTRLRSSDPWLKVKTTQRTLYDTARANLPEGVDEWIFLNKSGEVCEGTITNVFIQTTDGLITPPVASGLLPGVLRAELIASGRASEGAVSHKMITDPDARLLVGNSLRGLIKVASVDID